MIAVRRAVHALHGETERCGPQRWVGSGSRRALTRSAVGWLGLVVDFEEPPSERLVGLLAQLRIATMQYVVALRAEGTPPEEVLVCVKALMNGAMMDDGWWDRDATRSLIAAMVIWSIDAYYGQ